jgi:hypothetical protein
VPISNFPLRSLAMAVACTAVAGAMVHPAAVNAEAPTLVRNVDEPARNPYQQTVQSSDCAGGCAFQFATVPANSTLRITNVSCLFSVGDTAGVGEVYVGNGDEKQPATVFIPAVANGNPNVIVANASINLYAPAGSKPFAGVIAWTGAISTPACTLSGYFVTL